MEGHSREGESCQQFLDLIPNERDWLVRDRGSFQVTEEKKLELRLGPPGDWISKENCNRERHEESLLSLGYFPKAPKNGNPSAGAKRGFSDTVVAETGADSNSNHKVSSQKPAVLFQPPPWSSSPSASAFQKSAFLQFQMQSIPSLPVLGKESSHANASKVEMQQAHEKNPCSSASVNANAAVASNSQTRTASVPVVGWPPIRSFRKNIGNSSLKPASESQNGVSEPKEKNENCRKGLFVKINMDGVPIGRKVDLKAYDSYEKLSCAVDELFRALLAAQRDSTAAGNQNTAEELPPITGLLDGNGEYTLVYEDNEGDRMLVGDVPWGMFVTTVKRLRVLKSSELSALHLGSRKQENTSLPDTEVR
ncbi:auxin-responsive protein IAA26-like isoform X2 [Magnolia sinica]|uniref:auxin-responsive protein IAA26-like isoform X2 n=1 Tax=Magnolia sinica TaxID=86752 RepID=UPI0026580EC2|nr:auxin-responsive protein IAA26-like isoform X2 [Magnolia sinica]